LAGADVVERAVSVTMIGRLQLSGRMMDDQRISQCRLEHANQSSFL